MSAAAETADPANLADGIQSLITSMVAERGPDKTVCPSEVARAIAGSDETQWRLLMQPIRRVAVAMARAGTVTIRRKGRTVDPDDFKGIYRLGTAGDATLARADDPAGDPVTEGASADGAGNSASVRPLSQ